MAGSSFTASLVSLLVSFLTNANSFFHWTHILWANGFVGTITCLVVWSFKPSESIFGSKQNRGWMIARGMFSMLANLGAFLSFAYIPIGDAGTLMFTSPIFTALAAYCFLGQRWQLYEMAMMVTSSVGVMLVIRPQGTTPILPLTIK
jgi:drug/metabolite transporter (DMT)-like permease